MIQDPNIQTNKAPWPVVTADSLELSQIDGDTIKVRCIAPEGLYYDFQRRREGDVFTLRPQYVTVLETKGIRKGRPKMENGQVVKRIVTAEEQFSSANMERVDDSTPEHTTSAQEALNKAQDAINETKVPQRRR